MVKWYLGNFELENNSKIKYFRNIILYYSDGRKEDVVYFRILRLCKI